MDQVSAHFILEQNLLIGDHEERRRRLIDFSQAGLGVKAEFF